MGPKTLSHESLTSDRRFQGIRKLTLTHWSDCLVGGFEGTQGMRLSRFSSSPGICRPFRLYAQVRASRCPRAPRPTGLSRWVIPLRSLPTANRPVLPGCPGVRYGAWPLWLAPVLVVNCHAGARLMSCLGPGLRAPIGSPANHHATGAPGRGALMPFEATGLAQCV